MQAILGQASPEGMDAVDHGGLLPNNAACCWLCSSRCCNLSLVLIECNGQRSLLQCSFPTLGMCRTAVLLPACCRISSTCAWGSSSAYRAVLTSSRAAACPFNCRRRTGWFCKKLLRWTVVPWRCLREAQSCTEVPLLGLMPVPRAFLYVSNIPWAREVMSTEATWLRQLSASPRAGAGLEEQKCCPSSCIEAGAMPWPSSATVAVHSCVDTATCTDWLPASMQLWTRHAMAAEKSVICVLALESCTAASGKRCIAFWLGCMCSGCLGMLVQLVALVWWCQQVHAHQLDCASGSVSLPVLAFCKHKNNAK